MVIALEQFQKDPEKILEEAMEYDEPVILKTGLGNFVVFPESEYMGMMSMMSEGLEDTLSHIK